MEYLRATFHLVIIGRLSTGLWVNMTVVSFVLMQRKHPLNGGVNRRAPLSRDVRKLLFQNRKAWRRWTTLPSAIKKCSFYWALRQCNDAALKYLANQEDKISPMGLRKFFNYVSQKLHTHDNSIRCKYRQDSLAILAIFLQFFAKNLRKILVRHRRVARVVASHRHLVWPILMLTSPQFV